MNHAILQLKKRDRQECIERLRRDVPKTTALFCELEEDNTLVERPIYMSYNTERNKAITQIFSLRCGNPQLAEL